MTTNSAFGSNLLMVVLFAPRLDVATQLALANGLRHLFDRLLQLLVGLGHARLLLGQSFFQANALGFTRVQTPLVAPLAAKQRREEPERQARRKAGRHGSRIEHVDVPWFVSGSMLLRPRDKIVPVRLSSVPAIFPLNCYRE
ncbi:MAG: hypothetical protein U5O39_01360 [Gammaproteobacteria bacterium]|nr:hypothetical protein [Gammaproteobacteria bacterium]